MKNYFLNKAEEREKKDSKAVSTWDFQTVLGDAIRDLYGNKYVKILEIKDLVPDGKIPIKNFFPDMKVVNVVC